MEERRSVAASGKTVEDAIKNGLAMLGVRRDQVDIEVISEGSRGLLGIGAENARIRLAMKPPSVPKPAEPLPVPPPAPEPEAIAVTPVPSPAPAAEARKPTPEQVGREVLADLLGLMGIRATIELQAGDELADEGQPAPLVLNLTGDDLGILIGRRGETLRALQYLVRLMASHRLKHWTNLVVDVEDYRMRRRHALENLAARVAEDVVRTGRMQALEPMPPDERRVVHMTLRHHPKVMTQSIGEGERRKVTVILRR